MNPKEIAARRHKLGIEPPAAGLSGHLPML